MFFKFALRFAIILFAVIAFVAIGIHFFFSGEKTTLWILMMPVILAVPILSSILLATEAELSLS